VTMDNCTCTIDGAALGDLSAIESLDLSMTMEKDAALSEAFGGADIYQLHFAGSGQLPGLFAYTFKAGENKPGDTLYLYYYYEQSGVTEGIQSAVVDGNGYVTFTIYHCSSYIVSGRMIKDAAGGLADAAGEKQAEQANATDLEARLKAAQENAAQLEDQIEQNDHQLKAARNDIAALKAEAEGKLAVAPTVLALTVCGAALLAMFLTMLVCRAGLFARLHSGKKEVSANTEK
jgi:hypothetical protein